MKTEHTCFPKFLPSICLLEIILLNTHFSMCPHEFTKFGLHSFLILQLPIPFIPRNNSIRTLINIYYSNYCNREYLILTIQE